MAKIVDKKLKDPMEILLADSILTPLESKEELRDWMYVYFDIWFPMTTVYPTSTHSPVEAMWRIYSLMKTGKSSEIPEAVMLSSRDSGKTLSAAALEVLCKIHFRFSLGHMSAIFSQSEKSVQYVEYFFRKIGKYLEHNGWSKNSNNKRMIEWITNDGQNVYLKIVIATMAGANCLDPETIVITKNGNKKVSEVTVGKDEILTRDYRTGEDLYQPVYYKETTQKQTLEILLEDGSNLICSTDHQIFTNRGWITADQIKLGELLLKRSTLESINTRISSPEIKPKRNLEQLLLGTLLGDSSFRKTTGKRVRYSVGHCEDQREYIEMIGQVFTENSISFTTHEGFKKSLGYENAQKTITLATRTEDIFQELYKITHRDNKKRVSKEWIDRLDAEGFAYFVMDDGCVGSKQIGKGKESFLDLATCSFSEEENNLIINRLKELGINSYIYKVVNSVKTYPIIRIHKEDSRKFSEMIEPYFVNCLRYKLRTPKDHIKFRRYIDTAKPLMLKEKDTGRSFKWEDKELMRSFKTRSYIKKIRSQLNLRVVKIKRVGKRNLIDLSIQANDEHLKSFYANNILVHNSEHVPMLFCDEVDLISNPNVLEEAQLIPSAFKHYNPMFIYLSTLKFKGGLMQKTLDRVLKAGGEIYRWNIIDITERITHEEAQIDKPKVLRYITKELPMDNISPEKFEQLPEKVKEKYEPFEAYAGIAEHPLLPVMKNYLVDRPQDDHGGLFKKVINTLNLFRKISPEMADAQLLCNRPSSTGLVYPKFDNDQNVISIEDAFIKLLGSKPNNTSYEHLLDTLHQLGVEFYGGADWGHTDETSFVITAVMPNGDWWILDHMSAPGLEIPEIVDISVKFQNKYKIKKWFVDQNYPTYCIELRKKGLKVPDFTKDVSAGVSAVQKKIVNASNKRSLFIIRRDETFRVIEAFNEYSWKRDGKGDPIEGKPHHGTDGTSDVMDSVRYPAQMLFGAKSNGVKMLVADGVKNKKNENATLMQNKIEELATDTQKTSKKGNKKVLLWG